MKPIEFIWLFLVLTFQLSAQNVVIDSELQVESTELKINERGFTYGAFSTYDNKQPDSLQVSISKISTSSISIQINLINEPKVSIGLYSDYEEYNGKNTLDVDLEWYELVLNATKFKLGDRIIGTVRGVSKPIKNSSGDYQIGFEGSFNHIVGKLMLKRNANEQAEIIDHE